ncbi:MAG: EamA family transporter, partial [Salinivirgaceae bacterium]|nr:EamA family transporter [Salinivirgaceae bacterium]
MWITFAIISALFSAAAAITEKKTLLKDDPLVFSLVLAFFNLILSLPFFFFIDFGLISQAAIITLFIKSMLGALSFLLVMKGLKKLEISSSLPLLVLTPGLTAIFAYFILNEKLLGVEIVGMIILLFGTYLLQLKSNQNLIDPFLFSKQNKAYLYIIGALLIFTITSILDKTILGKYKMAPHAFLPIQHLFFVINFIAFFMF